MKAPKDTPHHASPSHTSTPETELPPPGIVILASLNGATENGLTPICLNNSSLHYALSGQSYGPEHTGKTVACIGVTGSDRLMIVGLVQGAEDGSVLNQLLDSYQHANPAADDDRENDHRDNGHEDDIQVFDLADSNTWAELQQANPELDVTIEAKRNLTFKCGASSVTLTADGRVTIRGKFVTTRASQLNRIAGGSVKIN